MSNKRVLSARKSILCQRWLPAGRDSACLIAAVAASFGIRLNNAAAKRQPCFYRNGIIVPRNGGPHAARSSHGARTTIPATLKSP